MIARLFLLALICALPMRVAAAPALTPEQQAVHVLNRLAFGPKPGDVERVQRQGVRAYIDEQLNPAALPYPAELTARLAGLDYPNRSAAAALGEYRELQRNVRDEDEGARERRRQAQARASFEINEARLLRAVDSPRQLEEKLVEFWFNHFNVFVGKGPVRALIPSYERDAIRPHVLGSFRALLGATAKHPAMLHYLDNQQSSAPRPDARGKGGRARGLNENYARELMELHTLGVEGGYTQQDVTELARMLTGWTFDQERLIRHGETFRFDPNRHDRAAKVWLGRSVTATGIAEGEAALDVLAVHPATARHLSYKLAQYFVADAPPSALVERMARTWIDSQGNIKAVLQTLFHSEEFMAPDALGAKFKTPYQFAVSAARASGVPLANVQPLVNVMNQLGQPLYGCVTPDGYKNTQAAWLNPDALSRRIGFASQLAANVNLLAVPQPQPVRPAGPRRNRAAALAMLAAGPMSGSVSGALADGAVDASDGSNDMASMGGMSSMGDMADASASMSASMGDMDARPGARVARQAARSGPAQPLDAAQLGATLSAGLSSRTRALVESSAPRLRAAMLLGSPDFMQH
jgi:uncharacterized protein (DUF1800 family)